MYRGKCQSSEKKKISQYLFILFKNFDGIPQDLFIPFKNLNWILQDFIIIKNSFKILWNLNSITPFFHLIIMFFESYLKILFSSYLYYSLNPNFKLSSPYIYYIILCFHDYYTIFYIFFMWQYVSRYVHH